MKKITYTASVTLRSSEHGYETPTCYIARPNNGLSYNHHKRVAAFYRYAAAVAEELANAPELVRTFAVTLDIERFELRLEPCEGADLKNACATLRYAVRHCPELVL